MSERMSNADIEDVLSSIRRLVSDDLRPGPVPAAPPAARAAVPRLVLTSALRVPPDPVPQDHAGPTGARDTLSDRLAELEVLMAGQAPQFEDDAAPAPDILPARAALAPAASAGQALPDPDPPAAGPEAPFIDADADAAPPAAQDRPDPEPPDPPETDPDSAMLQHEAVLRALIRDVLREELQGVMGERVTRNLRKLVRAEIARALTARGIA
jgi:hypothetical protein